MSSVDKLLASATCVRWARIDPDCPAVLHEPKRYGDVGWDLEAAEDVIIYPGEAQDVPTNVRLQLPDDIWAEIRARSSIARRGLQVDAGTIDPGYRGPLYALVRNMATYPWQVLDQAPGYGAAQQWYFENRVEIKAGERVAQVVFRKITPVWIHEVDQIDMNSERGEDGFGSTGR